MITSLISASAWFSLSLFYSPLTIYSPVWRTIDPGDFNEATRVEASIDQVTVFQGHAVISRKAEVTLGSESQLLHLPDLPRDAQELKIGLSGGEILRVIQGRRVRQSLDLKVLEEHVVALESLSREMSLIASSFEGPRSQIVLIEKLSKPKFNSNERERVALSQKAQKTRQRYREELESRHERAQRQITSLEREFDRKLEQYQSHSKAVRELSAQSQPKEVLEVYALVAPSKRGSIKLQLSYRVPNANWTPVYELHVDASRESLKRRFGVKVNQSSGEDWDQVALRVSTGDEQLILSRPQLDTWLLSERQQFRPRLTAARRTNPSPLFQAPAYRRDVETSAPEKARSLQDRISITQQEVRSAKNVAQSDRSTLAQEQESLGDISIAVGGSSGSISTSLAGRAEGRYARPSSRRKAKRRRPSPPPMAPRTTSRVSQSVPVAPMAESVASLADDAYMGSSRQSRVGSSTGLSLADQTQYVVQEEAYRYKYSAPNRSTIKSGAAALLVPMELKEQSIELIYETTPALSPHAFLTGQAVHRDELPILAGMASLFSSGSFVGESQLDMTHLGEMLTLYLGADSDVKVKRHLEVKTETSGLFSKTDTSVYTVHLQVANYKRRPIKVKLYDVLPISDDEEVKVKLLSSKPKTEIKDKKSGIASWLLELSAGEKRDVTLSYEIAHPSKKRVYQR